MLLPNERAAILAAAASLRAVAGRIPPLRQQTGVPRSELLRIAGELDGLIAPANLRAPAGKESQASD